MKKTLLAAAFCAALLIASCGNGGNQTSTASTEESASADTATVELVDLKGEGTCGACDSCVCDSCGCEVLVTEVAEAATDSLSVTE
ncbi:MAG: hypothetical protein LIO79_02725 [Rikenellaceae bacterium]|nr:hypothetical protein [Rikenellaceae bacterium]